MRGSWLAVQGFANSTLSRFTRHDSFTALAKQIFGLRCLPLTPKIQHIVCTQVSEAGRRLDTYKLPVPVRSYDLPNHRLSL